MPHWDSYFDPGAGREDRIVISQGISLAPHSSVTFNVTSRIAIDCGYPHDAVKVKLIAPFDDEIGPGLGDDNGYENGTIEEQLSRVIHGEVTTTIDKSSSCIPNQDVDVSAKRSTPNMHIPSGESGNTHEYEVTFTNKSDRDYTDLPVSDQLYVSSTTYRNDSHYRITCKNSTGTAKCPEWVDNTDRPIPAENLNADLQEHKGISLFGKKSNYSVNLPAHSSIVLSVAITMNYPCGVQWVGYEAALDSAFYDWHTDTSFELGGPRSFDYHRQPGHEYDNKMFGYFDADSCPAPKITVKSTAATDSLPILGQPMVYTVEYENATDSPADIESGQKFVSSDILDSYSAEISCTSVNGAHCPFAEKTVSGNNIYNAYLRKSDVYDYHYQGMILDWNDGNKLAMPAHSKLVFTIKRTISAPCRADGQVDTYTSNVVWNKWYESYNTPGEKKTTFICNSPSISASASTRSPKRGEDVTLSSTVRNSAGFVRNAPLSLTVPTAGLSVKDPAVKPQCVAHSGAQCPSDWQWDADKGTMTGSVPFLPIGGSLDVSLVAVADKDLPKASYDLTASISALGDVDTTDNTAHVPVEYGWTAGDVSARFVQVKADNTQSDIVDPVKLDTHVGDSYEAKPLDEGKVPEGYRLAFMPDNAKGTVPSDSVSVVFYYIPKDSTEQSPLEFETRYEPDASLAYGVQKVKTEGQQGQSEKVTSYAFDRQSGKLVSTSAQRTVSRPVTRVVGVGNREMKRVMRIVHFRDRATNDSVAPDQKDSVELTHSARVNAQSGALEGDSWSTGVWPVVRVPSSERYVRSIADVPGLSDSSATEDTEFTVWFDHAVVSVEQKQSHTRRVHFVDKLTGKKLRDDALQTVELTRVNEKDLATSEVSEGAWSEGVFAKLTVDPIVNYTASVAEVPEIKATEDLEVTVEFDHVHESVAESKTLTRRIHFRDKLSGKKLKDDVVQTAELSRVNEKDLATSEVSEGVWSEGMFAKLSVETLDGYTASLESVPEAKAIKDTEVTVEYTPVAEPVTQVPTVKTDTPQKKPVLAKTGVNVATGFVMILLLAATGVTLQMKMREHTKE
ncbi:mucin-binding protein [Alloscardovia macacae]|nr:G5 domain-containing protein [Alloscardovia macacae]